MMFPTTPGDAFGVSLSRPIRYSAAWVKAQAGGSQAPGPLGLWPDYKAATGADEFVTGITQIGPMYTLNLMQHLATQAGDAPQPID